MSASDVCPWFNGGVVRCSCIDRSFAYAECLDDDPPEVTTERDQLRADEPTS